MIKKEYDCSGTKITIYQPEQPQFADLKHVYDVVNALIDQLEKEKNIDISDLFYTKDDIEKMKKDAKYLFLKNE